MFIFRLAAAVTIQAQCNPNFLIKRNLPFSPLSRENFIEEPISWYLD